MYPTLWMMAKMGWENPKHLKIFKDILRIKNRIQLEYK